MTFLLMTVSTVTNMAGSRFPLKDQLATVMLEATVVVGLKVIILFIPFPMNARMIVDPIKIGCFVKIGKFRFSIKFNSFLFYLFNNINLRNTFIKIILLIILLFKINNLKPNS